MANDFLEQKLKEGCQFLNLEVGIISMVVGQVYTIVALNSKWPFFKVNDTYQLENTYCKEVVTKHKSIAFNHVGQTGMMMDHPVYLALQLETYIGTPLIIHNKIWGTLNFSSLEAKLVQFSEKEIRFVENLAAEIATYIAEQEL